MNQEQRSRNSRKRRSARFGTARLYMSVKELAERWGISLPHAYRLIERGALPCLRAGNSIRVPIAAVEDYEKRGAAA